MLSSKGNEDLESELSDVPDFIKEARAERDKGKKKDDGLIPFSKEAMEKRDMKKIMEE